MSTSDLEKGAHVLSSPERSHTSHPCSDFLPTYEEHLNTELLNFPQATPQANVQPFDRVSYPSAKKNTRRRRACWTAISTFIFLIVSGIIGTAIIASRVAHLEGNDEKTAPQSSMPARSLVTVTIIPSTVVVSVLAPSTSTSTLVVTVSLLAAPVSTSTPIITIFPSTASPTSQNIVTSTATFLAPTTLSEAPSVITTAAFLAPTTLSEAASTAKSDSSYIKEKSSTSSTISSSTSVSSLPPLPPPTTVSTTLISITTAAPTPLTSLDPPIETRTGQKPEFCGVPGEACA